MKTQKEVKEALKNSKHNYKALKKLYKKDNDWMPAYLTAALVSQQATLKWVLVSSEALDK